MDSKFEQIGGDHYKDMAIQPLEFCLANGLNASQTHAIGYIVRVDNKGNALDGDQDIRKAIHVLQFWLEWRLKERKKSPLVYPDELMVSGLDDED